MACVARTWWHRRRHSNKLLTPLPPARIGMASGTVTTAPAPVEMDEKKRAAWDAVQKLKELVSSDRSKYPAGYINFFTPNPLLAPLGVFYLTRYAGESLEHRARACSRRPLEMWAVGFRADTQSSTGCARDWGALDGGGGWSEVAVARRA